MLSALPPSPNPGAEFAAGDEITRRSFAIIRKRLEALPAGAALPPEVEPLVVRVAHTTGDVEFATTMLFSEGAVEAGTRALRAGKVILADVGMVRQGIRTRLLTGSGSRCLCLLDDPETAALAAREKITRSAAAVRRAAGLLDGAVVAIGNAPTALFELLALARAGKAAPALVIGVPVGFVGALESKIELSRSNLVHITNLSERGGSPIAAALVNGLIARAFEGEKA
jgi:precorrin-8X/cobalt-precorrin-8 methylmutase